MEKIQFTEDEYFFVSLSISRRIDVVEHFIDVAKNCNEPELIEEYKKEFIILQNLKKKLKK